MSIEELINMLSGNEIIFSYSLVAIMFFFKDTNLVYLIA